jgi:hypothetical protein
MNTVVFERREEPKLGQTDGRRILDGMPLFDAPLTFGEYMMRESPTLAEVFRVVFDHLRTRKDAVLFGAHAVNAYVDPPRMTADIDIMSRDAQGAAEDLRDLLAQTFHIAVRVRSVAQGRGFHVYQLRKPPQKSRHLVDVQQVDVLPETNRIEDVHVVVPSELIVLKLASYAARKRTEKGLSDKLDLHRMLRAFPEFRSDQHGPVAEKLRGSPSAMREAWAEILSERIEPSDDDG